MEKIMYPVWKQTDESSADWRQRLLEQMSPRLLAEDVHQLRVLIVDEAVAGAAEQCIINRTPPMNGVVSMWVDSALHRAPLEHILSEYVQRFDGYLVVESEPYPLLRQERGAKYQVAEGSRTPGMCQVAMLRCPPRLSYEQWYTIWREEHGPLAYSKQAIFGYRQNTVHRALTEDAPTLDAIVEENLVPEAIGNMQVHYAALGDLEKYAENQAELMESCAKFIDMDKVDCVQTSEYVMRR